ncbi:MAG: hypothetical protein WDZ69_00560 [Candidatus Pacearchaeota archaeon]
MAKKSKLSTPDWIKEGYDSKEEYDKAKGVSGKKKGKIFRIKKCPECGSSEVKVIVGGEEGKGSKGWECGSCSWKGSEVNNEEVSEDEFLAHLEKMDGK